MKRAKFVKMLYIILEILQQFFSTKSTHKSPMLFTYKYTTSENEKKFRTNTAN